MKTKQDLIEKYLENTKKPSFFDFVDKKQSLIEETIYDKSFQTAMDIQEFWRKSYNLALVLSRPCEAFVPKQELILNPFKTALEKHNCLEIFLADIEYQALRILSAFAESKANSIINVTKKLKNKQKQIDTQQQIDIVEDVYTQQQINNQSQIDTQDQICSQEHDQISVSVATASTVQYTSLE